jgi:prefoldin subunit 5
MPEALYPAEETAREVSFELDQWALVGADRLELAGRWFGVRGRRFVRPMLTLSVGDESQRSLADLEHKPWAAEEGEPWTAAFPLEATPAELEAIELAVAPDITLSMPLPAGTGGRSRPKSTAKRGTESREATDALRAEAERARNGQLDAAENRIGELEAERDDLKRELDRFHDELEQVHAEHEQLNAELDRLRADRRALREQRDRVRIEFDRVRGERDELASAEHVVRAPSHPQTAAVTRAPRYEPPPRRRRRKANWGGRVLAVLVFLSVIAALLVLVHHV